MRRRIGAGVVIAVLAALVLAAAASAVTLVTPTGEPARLYQRWADRSHLPTPDRLLTVRVEPCPLQLEAEAELGGFSQGVHGCAVLDAYTMYFDPVTRGLYNYDRADLLMHEIGHFVEMAVPQRVRSRFLRLLGLPADQPWDGVPDDHRTPSERFAEGYAMCARYPARSYNPGPNHHGYRPPSRRAHQAVCRMLSRLEL
jgi:hypothetical protein